MGVAGAVAAVEGDEYEVEDEVEGEGDESWDDDALQARVSVSGRDRTHRKDKP